MYTSWPQLICTVLAKSGVAPLSLSLLFLSQLGLEAKRQKNYIEIVRSLRNLLMNDIEALYLQIKNLTKESRGASAALTGILTNGSGAD